VTTSPFFFDGIIIVGSAILVGLVFVLMTVLLGMRFRRKP
jgi:hypothetical protein